MKGIDRIPAELNLARLLLEIRKLDRTVKSSLARSLHLSFATVSNLCKVLEENGYLRGDQLRESSGGRRAAEIRFNPNARFSVAMHIEHDLRVRLALLDLYNRVVEEVVVEPDSVSSVDELSDMIEEKHRAQLERHNIDD